MPRSRRSVERLRVRLSLVLCSLFLAMTNPSLSFGACPMSFRHTWNERKALRRVRQSHFVRQSRNPPVPITKGGREEVQIDQPICQRAPHACRIRTKRAREEGNHRGLAERGDDEDEDEDDDSYILVNVFAHRPSIRFHWSWWHRGHPLLLIPPMVQVIHLELKFPQVTMLWSSFKKLLPLHFQWGLHL